MSNYSYIVIDQNQLTINNTNDTQTKTRPTAKVTVSEIGCSHLLFDQVVTLGTKNSKTLGHFPKGAFTEYGKKGTIIGAYSDDQTLFGYVLFSITASKGTIRIVHLCIGEDHRGKGTAKLLLALYQKWDKIRIKARNSLNINCIIKFDNSFI